ncbi:hypothetical protein RirG_176400 [Rhizophagus irregularis DAOM 197198w]|uniref:Uncharacterized protein n=1 Tax=Rhizophagus irregularis (strain DAOM 197198w) TaxID=1432141 RepID=A0A015J250_RHIIW|nr:hypothetical protein RirG_176400 [Rhizophagus irregularis DAOM 197198w]
MDKPLQPSQDNLSTPNQPFDFTINDKQPNTLNEQNLVSKQQFETRENQNLAHSPVTSAKSPVTTPNTPSNKSVFPEWIIQQREQLQQKYPRDRFEIVQKSENFRIKCSDCPGRLYQPGPGLSLENFEIHLKNRDHRFNVEKRLNPDWTSHVAETSGSVIDNGGTIPGTIDASEFSSPVSGTGDPFTSINTNNRTIGLAEGPITSNTPMRSDFSRLHSSSSQSLEMPGTESARSSRGEAFSSKSKGPL